MSDRNSYGLSVLRESDPERYLACLYLPEHCRADVATLWAFDAEISRIPLLVSEALPGEIRIQWWRDLLKSGATAGSGPLADALMSVIQRHDLPRDRFDNYLEARIFDLYNDPMPDMGTLEGYLGETVSFLYQMAALCAGADNTPELADACGFAGVASGLVRLLQRLPAHRAREQIFFSMDVLDRGGFDRDSWLKGDISAKHHDVVLEMASIAERRLHQAIGALDDLPKSHFPVFIALAFSKVLLHKIANDPGKCLSNGVFLSPLTRHWVCFFAALKGRI